MSTFYEQLCSSLSEGTPFALGVITTIKGSSPQKKGAKALFFPDGRIVGTLGGGCLEAEVQDRARRAMRTGDATRFELVLDHDFGWDDGLICGGKVSGLILPRASESAGIWRMLGERRETLTWGVRRDYSIDWVHSTGGDWLYQETVHPPTSLWIAGSGHVAQAVVPLALQLDFRVTLFDDRPSLANHQFFPPATRIQVGPWDRLLESSLPPGPTLGLIVTRGHQHDALVLARWIQQPFAFLGMIGSRRKRRLILDRFVEDGLTTAEQAANVACPVGLDIQAVSVPEIAVSVMAQYVAVRAEITSKASATRSPLTQRREGGSYDEARS
jgi:xanthine dehydrogenase accessory factor